MKPEKAKKFIEILKEIKKSGKSVKGFCDDNEINYGSFRGSIADIKDKKRPSKEELKVVKLYECLTGKPLKTNKVETDDRAEINHLRDEEGLIQYYEYKIYKRNKPALIGKLSRDEMVSIYRLYTYYGDNLTQKIVSRQFVDLSLIDFKRILRAFNITKADCPFPPHYLEEKSEEELREIQLREKENSFLRKAEEDQIRNNEKLLKQYVLENIELKKQLDQRNNFQINIPENIKSHHIVEFEETGRDINLYLSDIHLGSRVTSGTLYKENINYGFEEAKRRLSVIIDKLATFDGFDTINLVLMGDNIDCCGVPNKTARLDHYIPENMDPREQVNNYIELILWFISSLTDPDNQICSKLNLYSVPNGNHSGILEYTANRALMAIINKMFPQIKTTLWEEFIGIFEHKSHTFLCCHGKDEQYMRKGLPLELNDKTKVMFYEFLNDRGIHSDKVHIVKGDLHSNSYNSCKRLDYRNVLSLYGASDYSALNFSRNSYGLSYDLFVGDNLIRGIFENI